MLRWCSYCQQFLGEVPDYQKLTITHGICATCEPRALEFTGSHFKLVEFLRNIQHRLHEAGRSNDLAAADTIIETAHKANIRAVDVLIGIVAPMLYQIGEDWRRNVISIAEEHRFTSFCHAIFRRIEARAEVARPGSAAPGSVGPGSVGPGSATRSQEPDVVLMNAPGNSHTLGIRILSLWLLNKGVAVRMFDKAPPLEELIIRLVASRTRMVLISMALADQLASVETIVRRIAELPPSMRPTIIIGGNAVKLRLVPAITGAEFMGDISLLSLPGAPPADAGVR
jgi:methanogenic corrinoid protein MtbC1